MRKKRGGGRREGLKESGMERKGAKGKKGEWKINIGPIYHGNRFKFNINTIVTYSYSSFFFVIWPSLVAHIYYNPQS